MISKITAFIDFILSFLFSSKHTKNTFSCIPSVETIETTDAINNKIQVNLSTNILTKTIYLFKYLEERYQFLIAENETLSQNIQKFKQDNHSAQVEIQKLCTVVSCLETRVNESESKSTELHVRNTILTDKIKELEIQKKALIEELGGAIGKEDLEYATWDLVLQTTKLLIQERDKVVKDNKELERENQLLTQTIQKLEVKISKLQFQSNTSSISISPNEIMTLKSSIQRLEQENRNKNSRIKRLEQGNSNNNEYQIQSLEQKNNEMKSHIEKLEKDICDKNSRIEKLEEYIQQSLEQIKILMAKENNYNST
nr:hypothetical protein [Nostocaceae cyanobacterium]